MQEQEKNRAREKLFLMDNILRIEDQKTDRDKQNKMVKDMTKLNIVPQKMPVDAMGACWLPAMLAIQ